MVKFKTVLYILLFIGLTTAVGAYFPETFNIFKETGLKEYVDKTVNLVGNAARNAYSNETALLVKDAARNVYFKLTSLSTNETEVSSYLKVAFSSVKDIFNHHPWACGFAAGAAAVGVGGPVVIYVLGFQKAGIAAGSVGAALMSSGLRVAALQSAGAAGISYATTVAGGAVCAAAAAHWITSSLECSQC